MQVSVPPVEPEKFLQKKSAETSAVIRKRVVAARNIQTNRTKEFRCNADLTSKAVVEFSKMNFVTERFAINAADRMTLSARGYYRLLKVARTIADLRGSEVVEIPDLAEALQYRMLRRNE